LASLRAIIQSPPNSTNCNRNLACKGDEDTMMEAKTQPDEPTRMTANEGANADALTAESASSLIKTHHSAPIAIIFFAIATAITSQWQIMYPCNARRRQAAWLQVQICWHQFSSAQLCYSFNRNICRNYVLVPYIFPFGFLSISDLHKTIFGSLLC